jgi:hypothetical protein
VGKIAFDELLDVLVGAAPVLGGYAVNLRLKFGGEVTPSLYALYMYLILDL